MLDCALSHFFFILHITFKSNFNDSHSFLFFLRSVWQEGIEWSAVQIWYVERLWCIWFGEVDKHILILNISKIFDIISIPRLQLDMIQFQNSSVPRFEFKEDDRAYEKLFFDKKMKSFVIFFVKFVVKYQKWMKIYKKHWRLI